MSKTRYRWWGYAKNVVRAYPKLMVAECLSADDQKERDAVTWAIEQTRAGKHGEETMELIRQVYWGGTAHRIEDVARRLYVSERTAQRRHSAFITAVGCCLGFETNKPPAKRGPRPKKSKNPSE